MYKPNKNKKKNQDPTITKDLKAEKKIFEYENLLEDESLLNDETLIANKSDIFDLMETLDTENDDETILIKDSIIKDSTTNDENPNSNDEQESIINVDSDKTSKKRKKGMENMKKRKKKKNNKKRKFNYKKFFLIIILIGLAASIAGAIFGYTLFKKAYDATSEINNNNFFQAGSTTNIYDRDGEFVTSLTANNISWVDLKKEDGSLNISKYYIDGLVSTEDEDFETHSGVNFLGLIKATVSTLFTDSERGGSTLTMQLAKILYMQDWSIPDPLTGLTKRGTDGIGYKLTQMSYALKIEEKYSKEQILENYINVINFGEGGYGIKNAAKYYFNKQPHELNISESAMLAGMTQLPNAYNPYKDPDLTQKRRDIVLERMLAEKYITQEEYDSNKALSITQTLVPAEDLVVTDSTKYSAYIDYVRHELLTYFDPNNEGFDIARAGMDIYTNLDSDLQKHTYDTLNTQEEGIFQDDKIQAGSAMVDTQTGEVLALGNGRNEHESYGGTNYSFNYNRQPGSTAKPIVDYGPAIEYLGWSTGHQVKDEKNSYDGGMEIFNSDFGYMGEITMKKAIGQSRNTVALQTFKDVVINAGLDSISTFMQKLGLTDSKLENLNQAYSIGGWSTGTTPLELAGSYAAFGNGGTYNKPKAIKRIDINKNSIYNEKYGDVFTPPDVSNKAMKPETSYLITEMLKPSNPEAQGYGGLSQVPGLNNLSLKTGTTNWADDAKLNNIPVNSSRDKWIASYTPNITTVTWIGYPSELEREGNYIYGGTSYEASFYRKLMSIVPKLDKAYLHDDTYKQPENVEAIKVTPNVWPFVKDPNGETQLFIKGSEDYKQVNEDFKNSKGITPNVTAAIADNKINLAWDYTGEFRTDAYWNIYVDNKLISSTKEMALSIPFKTLSDKATCKLEYTLTVELVETNDKKETRASEKHSTPVKFSNLNFCK